MSADDHTGLRSTRLKTSALDVRTDRYIGMLSPAGRQCCWEETADDAKEPVVIFAGSYRHKRCRALTDFARASVQISDLGGGGAGQRGWPLLAEGNHSAHGCALRAKLGVHGDLAEASNAELARCLTIKSTNADKRLSRLKSRW